ncbi:hypothetical protein NAP1_06710 [Erythrobacter sp. NAP1]|uniref:TIGR04222 domain-containing membrane protein n=1 Tax=Erythrobacter sp. NAP1 TaxID=237727 RepID=UPI0000686AEE|nr:TIGR04222 domain-containing membrane protein [Erythrobacter sp. NAP1]EAQ30448.1 hypothetical protein NAP1_06710 [Erythrobacter sp. NAP1]
MELFASYTGGDFLVFYCIMLVTCIFAGLWIPANLRPEGRRGEVEDLEEVAVLTGGADRLSVAVLSSLFAKGALDVDERKRLAVRQTGVAENESERAILAKVGGFRPAEAGRSIKAQAAAVETQLIRRGLMMDEGDRWKLRALSAAPYAALLAIGLYRQQAGAAIGEPTGFLVALIIITLVLGLFRFAMGNPRTMAGNEVVRSLEQNGSRLRRAPQANEAGYAVAIFGTGVLVGTPWEPVHAARQSGTGGDGGGSSDSGDGGGGCGGGCGGCGG